jgi:DNA-binding NarL/FixJ family response regulator
MIVCFSKNDEFLSRYPECLHVNREEELDNLENFILLLDLEAIDEKYFFSYIKLLSTCKAIFALTHNPNFTEGTHLLSLGVKGYGDINMPKTTMRDALVVITKGNIWLYPEFLQMMITSFSKNLHEIKTEELDKLSEREKEIANLVKKGLTNKEIAIHSDITERTVKAHLSSIYEKLNIKDRVALVIKLSSSPTQK